MRHPLSVSRLRAAAAVLGALVVLGGCSGDHSILAPRGPEASRISILGWGMIASATVITLVVFGLLVAAILPGSHRWIRRPSERAYLIGGGLVLPIVVLLTLSGFTVVAIDDTGRRGDADITVVGRQFWWEVRYRGAGGTAVTANEIHIPAGRRVRLTLRSADVIHSFWVPSLAGKIDMIPGRTNHLVIEADHPGRYRGQCAEFCGVEHARMAFVVVAEPEAAYERWLQHQATDARTDPAASAGREAFEQQACAGCHTIRGTTADGTKAPDLTHLAQRETIAALTVPNDRAHLRRWITDAQHFKPGALMPPIDLDDRTRDDIVDYLASLR